MNAQELVERWLGSEHGETPKREEKAKAAAARNKIEWADVLKAKEQYLREHPPSNGS